MEIKNSIVGIIGGNGGMGTLFSDLFNKAGATVIIASRTTELSVEECAEQSDILIITVPISSTIDVIQRVSPLMKKESLIMDLTSLKIEPVKEMLKYAKCEVIGCHPVFGPRVAGFKNQVVVLTPARGKTWLSKMVDLFNNEKAIVKVTTPEKHDKLMAVVQGLMHFTSITLVNCLQDLDIDINEINDYSSPVYRIRMDFANRILNQDPELYADIGLKNDEVRRVIKKYINTCENMLEIVNQKDKKSFIDEFKRASDYLGENKKTAEIKTDKIIDYFAKLES